MDQFKAFINAMPPEAACATLLNLFIKPGASLPDHVRDGVRRLAPLELAPCARRVGMSLASHPGDMVHGYALRAFGLDFEMMVRDRDAGGFEIHYGVFEGGAPIKTWRAPYTDTLIPATL